MSDTSYNTNVRTEEDLINLVNLINEDIELRNATSGNEKKEPKLNLDFILRQYRVIQKRIAKETFRKEHDCRECTYSEKAKVCWKRQKCLHEELSNGMDATTVRRKCSKDKNGDCPYGNEVGTCFGFCWKEILAERRAVQGKEDEDG